MNNTSFWNKQASSFRGEISKETQQHIQRSTPYLTTSDDVLDFACGTGQSTRAIAPHVSHVLGIDISPDMIQYAEQDTPSSTNITYKSTTLEHENYDANTFDIIFALNIFHLVDNLSDTINKLSHSLKPGGLLISNTPCMNEKKTPATYLIRGISKLGIFPKLTSFNLHDLESTIMNQDFQVIEKSTTTDMVPNLFIICRKT